MNTTVLRQPNFAALTLCEINPDHAHNLDDQSRRLVRMLVSAFAVA
ncbi:MAG: hypothetical protein M3529_09885 [Actinomycetota bacterium]|nr:hypothetical protein [Actinomycetota bacterium]MDQ3465661.1 hypothetical protein [Actinomycetota bacterium]